MLLQYYFFVLYLSSSIGQEESCQGSGAQPLRPGPPLSQAATSPSIIVHLYELLSSSE